MKNLKKIKGDASFRNFFRKKNKNYSSIIVFEKKEKFQSSSNHLYIIKINSFNKKNFNKDKLINVLKKQHNIYTTTHYPALNKQSYFKKKFKKKKFFNSENYSLKAISLPIHPLLKIKQVNIIIKILKKYISKKYD